jgi:hypothetical protein
VERPYKEAKRLLMAVPRNGLIWGDGLTWVSEAFADGRVFASLYPKCIQLIPYVVCYWGRCGGVPRSGGSGVCWHRHKSADGHIYDDANIAAQGAAAPSSAIKKKNKKWRVFF